jgi:phospholipase C
VARVVAVVVAVAGFTALAATSVGGAGVAAAATAPNPIKHVVVIMQENHSFDNMLGKFCAEVAGGQIVRPGTDSKCNGATSGVTSTGQQLALSPATNYVPSMEHSVSGQAKDIDGGKMDGFSTDPDCSPLSLCYSQYDPLSGPCQLGSCIPNYATLAKDYAVSDMTFETQAAPSWTGHLVLATADPDGFQGEIPANPPKTGPTPVSRGPGWGCDAGTVTPWGPNGVRVPSCIPNSAGSLGPNWVNYTGTKAPHVPTIFDELESAGLTWKIYGGAGEPGTATEGHYSGDGWAWAICPSIEGCLYTSQRNNLVAATNILTDAADGNLPSYSIMTPLVVNSQHNNNEMSAGDNWIGQVITALQASPEWSSTAIFVTYDDCGCFYDHVDPLKYGQTGIRVPTVIVSPYAKAGYTDAHSTNFIGMVSFVQHLFGLPALNSAESSAYDYSGAFCYNPAKSGCIQAGLSPVTMVSQTPTPMTAQQKALQTSSGDST